jgi:hypothetical protein
MKANPLSYNKRPDKYFFEKLAKKLGTEDEVEKFFVANMLLNSNLWIGEAFDDSTLDLFYEWKKKNESLKYSVQQDFEKIFDIMFETKKGFPELFVAINGQHPLALQYYLQNTISIETMIFFDSIIHNFQYWNDNIKENIIWPTVYKKCVKYQGFIYKYAGQELIQEIRRFIREKIVDIRNSSVNMPT